jgi:hypothetical protein
MTAPQLYRLCGYALVIGAIVSIITQVVSAVLFPRNNDPTYAQNALFVPLALISVAAAALLLLGLPGWYAMHARAAGVSGLVGFVAIFITGLMFPIFFNLFGALIFPLLATQAPQLLRNEAPSPAFFSYFIVGTLLQLVGVIGLAIPMLRGRVLPRWPGYALVVSAPLVVVSFFLNGPDVAQSALTVALNNLPVLLLFVAFVGLGWKLLTKPSEVSVPDWKTSPLRT